jgi:hypothetical protein
MIMNATAKTPRRRCSAVLVVDVVGVDVAMAQLLRCSGMSSYSSGPRVVD